MSTDVGFRLARRLLTICQL